MFCYPKNIYYFCKTQVQSQYAILVIPYNSLVRIEDTASKWSLIVHVGCINENNGQNWILWYLKDIIMFINMQYDFAYLKCTCRQIAASVCCGMLINNMSVSDETSLLSSEVECMGLDGLMMICGLIFFRIVWYKFIKPLRDNTCQIDNGYMCIWTVCQTKSTCLIPM